MLGRTVAIKVIHPHLLSDEQSVARFYTEARAASRLNHPNSVSIIDFGRTDDGILYLVMEYLQGKDLARLMREDGPLPIMRICDIVSAVLDALGEAHALDVVHRDLKPENVIIERLKAGGDLIKVVDFGLAKLLRMPAGAASITLPGLVCGTPDYMSPEQGRGEEVDARGDIYSVGVMLFELLTERLPFMADTPTNVVLKHIQEPVPDPREIAPEREIPAKLVDIVMNALEKDPTRRYKRADEMAKDLRRMSAELSPRTSEVVCVSCGARSPSPKRFCAECGAPLPQQATPPSARMSLPPRMTIARTQHPLLIGRRRELEAIEAERISAQGRFVAVNVVGESGVGRTRLLAEVAERAARAGDVVVGAGPHESGAPVAYHPLHMLLRELLGHDDLGLAAIAEREAVTQPLVAAGIREVLSPSGVIGSGTQEAKVGAVACALGHAVRVAELGAAGKRIVLVVDDLHRCDGLSPRALAELPRYSGDSSLFLLTASGNARPLPLPPETTIIQLRGFTMEESRAFMAGSTLVEERDPEPEERLLVPLYIEQLSGLGLGLTESSRNVTLPSRLADAVAQRIQRLNVSSRRLLQAISVLGRSASKTTVEKLADRGDMSGLALLLARGFVVESDGSLQIIHPFVRALVEASTPAEARKALHMRALELASETDAPLEVRAHHAYGAGEALSALVLLERLGDVSASRGDLETAVLGYQRGIELCRRELLESGDTSLDDALASMSRRLGSVLARRLDIAGAEGVLREALEYTSQSALQRAQILVELARVVAQRNRVREAYRLLGQALELTYRDELLSVQIEVQLALAELRREERNMKEAASALRVASDLCVQAHVDATRALRVRLLLAETLAESGEHAGEGAGSEAAAALAVLDAAEGQLAEGRVPYFQARAAGLRARLAAAAGKNEDALLHYKNAARFAALAGAADLARRLENSGRRLLEES
ncbi:MAG TPA: protein kinase, partial [Polyangiales bacterium]|nr:protein kinase [Polyangiales bacterium]